MITKIEWTATPLPDGTVLPGYTFNPWSGCTKVSDGCRFCYADTMAKRTNQHGVWGPKGQRQMRGPKYWNEPAKWNAEAERTGVRRKVFCASMADVFEGADTMPASAHADVKAARARLFELIEATPHLDWLLLTKRPELVMELVPDAWCELMPANVWIGTSAENQDAAEKRIPHLLEIPARVRFLSCEPLLGPVDLAEWLYEPCTACDGTGNVSLGHQGGMAMAGGAGDCDADECRQCNGDGVDLDSATRAIHWVIAGGESGPMARPMHPNWPKSLANECTLAGVPFFFKQWGEHVPEEMAPTSTAKRVELGGTTMVRVGKANAGRLLFGREWSAYPQVEGQWA